MSSASSGIHRRCEKCERVHRTGASKRWKCPWCSHWNRITHAEPQKPARVPKLMKTGIDQYVKPKPEHQG